MIHKLQQFFLKQKLMSNIIEEFKKASKLEHITDDEELYFFLKSDPTE